MNWTETRERLIKIGIDADRLPEEWRPGINLSETNLDGADLSETNLSETNLSGAKLSETNLSEADLSGADLRWANLRGANLRGAKLRGAKMRWANLREADGPFTTGYFGHHHAIAAGGYISIGCKRHTYDEWLEQYEVIGAANRYTADEIASYGAWIKMAVARQRQIEETAKSE